MNTKEKWIEDTLNSLDEIRRAPSTGDLLVKIEAKLAQPDAKTVRIQHSTDWYAAAGLALLITMNIFGILYYHKAQTPGQAAPSALASEYLSYLEPIKL